ncbi:MAG: T9SS type A sorting domain-containing protein [Bacteroidota bacterium]
MKIQLLTYFICILGVQIAFAQNNNIYNGGTDDGFDALRFLQQSNNSIYRGGSGDGFDGSSLLQAANNTIFFGGNGDGYNETCLLQAANNPIYVGGNGDGYEESCFLQVANNSIFAGSNGDGFDVICFEQNANNGIFFGGSGDGYNETCFFQASNNNIFEGGFGDGFDVLCFEQASNNTIFFGGNGDGYAQQCELVNDTPLPIELLVFDGELLNEDESLLRWVVASEIDNAFFVLERSIDARNFDEVAVIASLGNTQNTREYVYKDFIRPLYGNPVVYYRLKQVDLDESYEYTHVIALNLPTETELQEYILYPNPAKERVFIRYANATNDQVQVELYDNLGRQLVLETVAALDLEVGHPIDLYRLPEGSYHIRIIDGDQIYTKTFMKTGL